MKRIFVCCAVVLASASTFFVGDVVVGAANPSKVVFSDPTVTAAPLKGNSAVIMSITNDSSGPISLTSVSSPTSATSMIFYDANMCQGNHAMSALSNLLIEPGHTQKLAFKYQGAMLSGLRSALKKGATVPIVLKWSNFSAAHTVTLQAKVIKAPKGLKFIGSGPGMSGMSGMNMSM